MSSEEVNESRRRSYPPTEFIDLRMKKLIDIIIELNDALPDKHVIAILKSGDAIFGYDERVQWIARIMAICQKRTEALTRDEYCLWKRACEFEVMIGLWDMLEDIHRFPLVSDLTHPTAFAFYAEYACLRIADKQITIKTEFRKILSHVINDTEL